MYNQDLMRDDFFIEDYEKQAYEADLQDFENGLITKEQFYYKWDEDPTNRR